MAFLNFYGFRYWISSHVTAKFVQYYGQKHLRDTSDQYYDLEQIDENSSKTEGVNFIEGAAWDGDTSKTPVSFSTLQDICLNCSSKTVCVNFAKGVTGIFPKTTACVINIPM